MDGNFFHSLPRAEHAEHLIRAWLSPGEERMFDALLCRDLTVEVEVSVCLFEDRGKKSRSRKRYSEAEQAERDRRETLAGDLIEDYGRAQSSTLHWLKTVATLRRLLHYAKLKQEPPSVAPVEATPCPE